MKNDFAKIIFHPQEPPAALPAAKRTFFLLEVENFQFSPSLNFNEKVIPRHLLKNQIVFELL